MYGYGTDEAMELIHALIEAEVTVMKQVNGGNGRVTKKADREERAAVSNLFLALTGERPTDEQMTEMVEL